MSTHIILKITGYFRKTVTQTIGPIPQTLTNILAREATLVKIVLVYYFDCILGPLGN